MNGKSICLVVIRIKNMSALLTSRNKMKQLLMKLSLCVTF